MHPQADIATALIVAHDMIMSCETPTGKSVHKSMITTPGWNRLNVFMIIIDRMKYVIVCSGMLFVTVRLCGPTICRSIFNCTIKGSNVK